MRQPAPTFMGKPCKKGHNGERYISNKSCVFCNRDAAKKHREENPEHAKAKKQECRLKRYDHYREREGRWARENPEAARACQKKWAAENRDRINAVSRAYYARNSEAHAIRVKAWEAKNPGARVAINARRRCRVKGAEGSFTAIDIAVISDEQCHLCAYCHADLNDTGFHVDHFIPLFNGGTNWPWNLQLLCPECNQKKHAKDPFEFERELIQSGLITEGQWFIRNDIRERIAA